MRGHCKVWQAIPTNTMTPNRMMPILFAAAFAFSVGTTGAQTTTAAPATAPSAAPALTPSTLTLQGNQLDGKPFNLSTLKGKVVLVFFWSTDCAVCRDKMPELRENYAGWRTQPFELVAVSVDAQLRDTETYEKAVATLRPSKHRFIQMWAGDASYSSSLGKPTRLPAAYLLDKSGKIVEQYLGRIPAEAWDRIADLL